MVQITIIAAGKLKESWWADAADEYLKRLKPYAKIKMIEVADRDIGRDPVRAVRQEGEALLKAVPKGVRLIALDERGKQRTSVEWAEWMDGLTLSGESRLAFVIGGTAGLSDEVLQRADERVSLGYITLPHQLVRVVLLEQVYRIFRISRGEPYHY